MVMTVMINNFFIGLCVLICYSMLLSLMYDEFAHFGVAFVVGEVGHVDAWEQADAYVGLAVGHRLGVEQASVGGIDAELCRAVAVVHNRDAAASTRGIGIDAEIGIVFDVICFGKAITCIVIIFTDTDPVITIFQRTSYVVIL